MNFYDVVRDLIRRAFNGCSEEELSEHLAAVAAHEAEHQRVAAAAAPPPVPPVPPLPPVASYSYPVTGVPGATTQA